MALSTKSTRNAIAELDQRERDLLDNRKKIDEELSKVRAARAALQSLESDEPVEFDGPLADAVRVVLKKNVDTRSLAPTDVRDEVKTLGFDFGKLKHDNPMAAIHGVLKRLLESGEARPKKMKDGSTRYVWNGPREAGPVLPVSYQRISVEAADDVFRRFVEQFPDAAKLTTPHQLADLQKVFAQSGAQSVLEQFRKAAEAAQPPPDVLDVLGIKPKK